MKKRSKAAYPAVNFPNEPTSLLRPDISLTSQAAGLDIGNSPLKVSEITQAPDRNAEVAIYKIPKVSCLTGLSRSSIYRLEALGLFPRRVKLSASASGWRSNEIHAWIASRPSQLQRKGAK